jgi:hypothetical protein
VEHQLCAVFAMLLEAGSKAEAAYYSTVNFKARCDLVRAVAARSDLDARARGYLEGALEILADAADARNNLMHGLFRMEAHSGKLL